MPLYEDRRNAENKISVSATCLTSVLCGTKETLEALLSAIKEKADMLGRAPVIAFDGWYGVDWKTIIEKISAQDRSEQIGSVISFHTFYQTAEAIAAYKKPFITDDPGFGFVNETGKIGDLFNTEAVTKLVQELKGPQTKSVLLYGCGSAAEEMLPVLDMIVYFDKTRQPILWQMWEGALVPLGSDKPNPNYFWKEYYYNDYYMLDRQKENLYERMDFWVEAISPDQLKLVPRDAYDEIITTLLKYPIKEIKIYQPGPWGAYRYKDLFDVPGLECNAWNELAGPELGMMVVLGEGKQLEMPMLNLMQYQKVFLGEYLTKTYPGLFPLDVWLDDGYFPEKTPIERTAMPIHNHPSTSYVKKHFNEPLGRYETYYICEAYEGACSIMGYEDDVDLEEWENICRTSDNLKEIKDWEKYIHVWDSNVGDLYLIPPGTVHAHGGNQMVLEMDTCPSVAATEYSFFSYDFARNSWDDTSKTMTGKPVKMHMEHSFDNEKWRRTDWVKNHLLSKAKVEKWTKDYKFDRYSSVPEMPFEIERFHYATKAEGNTDGQVKILTLTIGNRAIIQSKADPELKTEIECFQSAILPAVFGAFELISPDGGFCEIVQFRWKS